MMSTEAPRTTRPPASAHRFCNEVIAVTLLIPLIVIVLILAASVWATDSRDGRDWTSPMIDQHGYRIGGRTEQQCCA